MIYDRNQGVYQKSHPYNSSNNISCKDSINNSDNDDDDDDDDDETSVNGPALMLRSLLQSLEIISVIIVTYFLMELLLRMYALG